jgi:hypothetical protein
VKPTGQIFMSYSRKDSASQQAIMKYLRGTGLEIWVDKDGLEPGTPEWETTIEEAINSSIAFVVILSPDANNSSWVLREITYADQHHKRIFPVLVRGAEESSIPLRLVTNQFVDLRTDMKSGLKALHKCLDDYMAETTKPQKSRRPNKRKNSRAGIVIVSILGVAAGLAGFFFFRTAIEIAIRSIF